MSWVATGVMVAAGVAKSEFIDRPAAERQRKLAASTAAYSPWTHMQPGAVKEADPIGTGMQFGVTGAAMGSGMAKDQSEIDANKAYADRLNTGGSVVYGGQNIAQAKDTVGDPQDLQKSQMMSGPDYKLEDKNPWTGMTMQNSRYRNYNA